MHELSKRRCVHLTKSLCWIGIEVGQVPVFYGLSNIKEFLKEYEAQVPSSQRLQALDVALRTTLARWWVAHKRNIATWETCHRLLINRFGEDVEAMNYRYDGQIDPRVHIQSCVKAWKHCSVDEWVHLFVHTLDTNPRNWYIETELRNGTQNRSLLIDGFTLLSLSMSTLKLMMLWE